MNLAAGRGIAIREFPLGSGYGTADYLLYGDRKALGTVEAKKVGDTLTGVEVQSEKYASGLPKGVPAWAWLQTQDLKLVRQHAERRAGGPAGGRRGPVAASRVSVWSL